MEITNKVSSGTLHYGIPIITETAIENIFNMEHLGFQSHLFYLRCTIASLIGKRIHCIRFERYEFIFAYDCTMCIN